MGQIFFLKFSLLISVIAFGFFISEPSLANILLNETPMLTVSPISSLTDFLISSAISIGLPIDLLSEISSQFSSIPKGSTRFVYLLYMLLTSLENLRYSSY